MTKAAIKSAEKWLTENRFNYRVITMTDGTNGIMVDTNYEGPYPDVNTFEQINRLNKRFIKRYTTEVRGYYTGYLIK